jgi:hypothetical protein
VDDASDSIAAVDSDCVEVGDGRWCRFEGRGLVQGSVRSMLIVMGFVLTKNPQQMPLVPDPCLVEEFASAAADPAFHDRVRAGRSDGAAQNPDAGAGEDRVEGGGELGVAIAKQELDRLDVPVEAR